MSGVPRPPTSFHPLDSRDGVPGNAAELTALARRYADTAAEIEAQAAHLAILTSQAGGGWKGEAGDTFAEVVGDLSGRLGRAKGRYEAAARALTEFADTLEEVQTAAYGAVRRAQAADDAQRALQHSVPAPPGPDATPEELALADEEQRLHDRAVTAASTDLAAARRDYEDAVEDYHRAAEHAARTLRNGRRDDGLADGWWDRNAGRIDAVLDVISAVAVVLTVVGVLIVVLATGGAALGAFLLWAAAGLTGISLGFRLALWVTDNGSGEDVLWDLAGVLTFGTGRVVGAGARGLLRSTSRVAGRVTAAHAGRRAFDAAGRSSLLFDLGRLVPSSRALLGRSPVLRAALTAADEAGEAARAGVAAAAATSSTRLTRGLAMGDDPTAQALSAICRIDRTVGASARLAALTGAARSMVVGGVTVPGLVTTGHSGFDVQKNFFSDREKLAQQARAEIVDRWSLQRAAVR